MRTREEIINSSNWYKAVLEVLLDIRDLLEKQVKQLDFSYKGPVTIVEDNPELK